jgi:hypothetical protein
MRGELLVEVDRRVIASPDDVVVRAGTTQTVATTLTEARVTPAELFRFLKSWPFGEWIRGVAGGDGRRCEA